MYYLFNSLWTCSGFVHSQHTPYFSQHIPWLGTSNTWLSILSVAGLYTNITPYWLLTLYQGCKTIYWRPLYCYCYLLYYYWKVPIYCYWLLQNRPIIIAIYCPIYFNTTIYTNYYLIITLDCIVNKLKNEQCLEPPI